MDGIEWSSHFGPDSVNLSLKDLSQEMSIKSQENPLPEWNLLLSQVRDFLDKHLAEIPITPNQRRTFETRREVLASAGA